MVVASDHGFTSLDYEVHFNEWLRENGWLSYDDDNHDSLADITDDNEAYSLIPGRFYINLDGREPRGAVTEENYEETRAQLTNALETLEGPDGRRVCARVVEKEDAFYGASDDIAPDLVAIPNYGFDLKAGFAGHDGVFGTGPRNGMHSFDNACLFIDDASAGVGGDTDLFDITPTLLDLMDIEYDHGEFDGSSLA